MKYVNTLLTITGVLLVISGCNSLVINHVDSVSESNNVLVIPEGEEYRILKLEVKQKHYNLNIGDHIKDNINAFTFEIPVDPHYFSSVDVGDIVASDLRTGSLVAKGSIGKLEIKVVDKYVK